MVHTIERPDTRPSRGSELGGAWKVIELNDDHNTFDHVARTLARIVPGVTIAAGYALADRIHHAGLAVVWTGHRELAEHYRGQLGDAGLTMAPLERA